MILNPLLQVLIYILVFSNLMSSKVGGSHIENNYSIYVISGILCWGLINELINELTNHFIVNQNLQKKNNIPKFVLVLITVGKCLLNNFLFLISSLVLIIFLSNSFSISYLWLPILIFISLFFSLSIGLVLGILNVFIRDVGYLTTIVLSFTFWLTPIIYPIEIIPEYLRTFISLNPIFPIVNSYHNVMVYNLAPDFIGLSYSLAWSLILYLLAYFLFKKTSQEITTVL
jgi:lipopolysaccharide transport system permease protein